MRMHAMKRLGTAAIKVALVVFLAIGIAVFAACTWAGFQRPSAFAKPNTFMIIETYSSSNMKRPIAKIYLEAPSSPADLRFEGTSLRYQFTGVSHEQASLPLKGVVVSGSGTIVFGTAKITVNEGTVAINGRQLSCCSSGYVLLGTPSYEIRGDQTAPDSLLEVVLGRNGWYYQGYIRLGNGLLMRLLYR